ncbi:helix-turn-helix domain-containing protein [Cellulosimicrobium funkei]|jgi:transcriptional regulator with XRE-family HTH domain|uniref:helix-turn-helix domain-containing protein n=1 Tax=Cellulosimicrobium funkei TaxID=264251 RepID=UPI0037DD8AE3
MGATLRLRKTKLASYRRLAGIDTDQELARRIDMDPSSVSRILKGNQAPGPRFIAGLVVIFGVDLFPDLFEVVEQDDTVKDAA